MEAACRGRAPRRRAPRRRPPAPRCARRRGRRRGPRSRSPRPRSRSRAGRGSRAARPSLESLAPRSRSTRPRSTIRAPDRLGVDAAAVVGDVDGEHAGAVARLEAERAALGLARGPALGRRLDAVVERVAQQVVERRLEPLEDVAVDADGLADDRRARPACRACAPGRAPGAGSPCSAVAERAHAAGDRLAVEPTAQVVRRGARRSSNSARQPSQLGPARGERALSRWRRARGHAASAAFREAEQAQLLEEVGNPALRGAQRLERCRRAARGAESRRPTRRRAPSTG